MSTDQNTNYVPGDNAMKQKATGVQPTQNWNLVTACPKGMSYNDYKELRRSQNIKVRSYRRGTYFWYSNGIRPRDYKGSLQQSFEIQPQGTYRR